MNTNNEGLVQQLIELINKGNAHVTFTKAVENIAFKNLIIKPHNLPYNIFMLAEHMRITQADILSFSKQADYKELKWPDEYWPSKEQPESEEAWQNLMAEIEKDRNEFITLLQDSNADLYRPFPHGSGQNLLREAFLIADHNSYHTGEIVLIRRLLNDWHH